MREFIIGILENAKGDDLFRARMAFSGLSEKQMNQEYGQSGRTRNQILQEYKDWSDRIESAIAWMKKVKE